MTRPRRRLPWRAGVRAVRARADLARRSRGDAGQVIVIVVVLVALLAALGPVMASQVTGDAPLLVLSTNRHAALAAAEAGIQWYRNHLDADSNYYLYSASNPASPADPAMATGGWCSSACDLGGTSPGEAFHYVPDDSSLFSTTGTNAGRVVLTVTGRAGSPGSYAYVTARTSFATTSILDNAYYSNTEVLDPLYPDEQQTTVQVSDLSSPQPITQYSVTYGSTTPPATSSLWTALCDYETYNPNTFVDWLGAQGIEVDYKGSYSLYTASHPYYGPYFGSDGFTFTNANGAKVTVGALPCGGTFDFNTGETFNGPVYSTDQLHVCGSPTFSGAPISYTSGASSSYAYAYDWPGSVFVNGYYRPSGTTVDPVRGVCGQPNSPNFVHKSSLDGDEVLPAGNLQLAEAAAAGGCLYTGPTMIALVTSGGTTTMNVWSPLSSGASAPAAGCSTGDNASGAAVNSFGQTSSGSSSPYITGIPLPPNGVVYVQDAGATATLTVNDGITSGCRNPYVNQTQPNASAQTCVEGDAYVEGELHGELTIGAQANVIVTRDLTYACADGTSGAGPASRSDPSSVSACTTGTTPDVLGLEAADDVLVSRPVKSPITPATLASYEQAGYSTYHQDVENGAGNCTYDGTPATVSMLPGGSTSSVSNGQPDAVWPSCDITNPIVDAAVISLHGAFGVEYWDQGSAAGSNGVFLNGADISQYRGPFGLEYPGFAIWGYNKEFSFDSRLEFLQPPFALQSAVTSWQELGYVVCGNGNTATETTPACPPIN